MIAEYAGDRVIGYSEESRELAHEAIYAWRAMQKERELATFIEFLKGRKIGNVVEIGGMFGGTTKLFSRLARGRIVTVDLFVLEGRMECAQDVDYIFINADSHLPATRDRVLEALDSELVDLLFIDGDHSLSGVTADFDLYSPLVSSGGAIALHDTAVPHQNIEAHNVIPLWEEVRSRHEHFQIFDGGEEGDWGGIGVLLP